MDNNNMIEQLRLLPAGMFGPLDLGFAGFVCRSTGYPDNFPLFLGAALACNAAAVRKHTCIDLKELSGDLNCWFTDLSDIVEDESIVREQLAAVIIPERFRQQLLKAENALGVPQGNKVPFKPLILDGSLLYICRDYLSERKLAALMLDFCRGEEHPAEVKMGSITRISPFFNVMTKRPDWQQLAVAAALRNRMTVISGGPGTGKTTVAAAITALLLEQNPELKMSLCAPTGKAQARLQESVKSQFAGFDCSDEVKALMDNLPVSTIHRLLGSRPGSTSLKYNEANQLNLDVLIVDEASMISQRLMKALFAAIPTHCKIILLGDMQQLASVESGMVLKDFCQATGQNRFSEDFINGCKKCFSTEDILPEPAASKDDTLADCVIELRENHRFSSERGLGLAAAAIRALPEKSTKAAVTRLVKAMRGDDTGEISLEKLPSWQNQAFEQTVRQYFKGLQVESKGEKRYFTEYLKEASVRKAYEMFNKFRFLCVHRRGFYGVGNLNKIIERSMYGISGGREFYPGKPLIINENCHAMRLYNGDTGMVWQDENGNLKAFFPPLEEGAEFRRFELGVLPSFSPAYALTVHKSQGSGFQQVLIITPDKESPLMTREMIYTAITRAEKRAVIWSSPELLAEALKTPTSRCSNLRNALINR
ncbi:MAG: exodeoxyribonuclease V subunit alpha [Lentisphaerae bacterium]|nr:exodeoxyribonuclease V subunit alpha [Lentisphaerota bacterium]MCP4100209.1 exodeoxyribonuclease V subunit alpha [Lentisphaerota bacterium]